MTGHIFISYRSTQRALARKIAASLRQERLQIWLDIEQIQAGDDWIHALSTGLNDACALLPIVSPAYIESSYCRRELQRADALGTLIVPVLAQEISPEQYPLELQTLQYVDISDAYLRSDDEAIDTALQPLVAQLTAACDRAMREDNELPAAPGTEPPKMKQVEDKLLRSAQQLSASSMADAAYQRKRKRLQSRVDHLYAQWEAANAQLDRELSAANRVILNKQLDYLDDQIDTIQAALDRLKASL